MTKPIEELKEKARLTDGEIKQSLINRPKITDMRSLVANLQAVANAQQDKDFKAFAEWCDNNKIYKVEKETKFDTELYTFTLVSEVLKPVSSLLEMK